MYTTIVSIRLSIYQFLFKVLKDFLESFEQKTTLI